MPEQVEVVAADDALWSEFNTLATRSYGHPVADIIRLRPYGDARVGIRDGRVVAGGLGLLVPAFFGGRPVPAACMGDGCVAPEERGHRLTVHMMAERIRPLREQGAAVAMVWTTSTGYGHRLGWAAPAQVFSWTVPTDELKRSFDASGYEIRHGSLGDGQQLQQALAAQWNGAWQRPPWWQEWQREAHPGLESYLFHHPQRGLEGILALAFPHTADGRQVVVQDFWAATGPAAAAMLAFIGRHNSRIPTALFERTGLPPTGVLLEQLHRVGAASARHWHSWMLRVLDLRRAVQLRGWPEGLEVSAPIEVADPPGADPQRFTLTISDGRGDLEPSQAPGLCVLTAHQFSRWYAGGYRTVAAAGLGGISGDRRAISDLVRATIEHEPWLPDYF